MDDSIAVNDCRDKGADDCTTVIVGRDQAEIRRRVRRPVEQGEPIGFYIPRRKQNKAAMLASLGRENIRRQRICLLAQWDAPYLGIARRWRRRVALVGKVEDLCADRCGRDDALAAMAGAGLVVYFGHASHLGFDGYHGIAHEDMRLQQPIGVLVSWSCNAIFGRSAFGIRLVQSGLVRAFIGTTDSAAKTRDNTVLAQIAAESLVGDRPLTVGDWVLAIDKIVAGHSDPRLSAAWHKFRVVGNINEPLPSAMEPLA